MNGHDDNENDGVDRRTDTKKKEKKKNAKINSTLPHQGTIPVPYSPRLCVVRCFLNRGGEGSRRNTVTTKQGRGERERLQGTATTEEEKKKKKDNEPLLWPSWT